MKDFHKKFRHHRIIEWKEHYVDYKTLMLYASSNKKMFVKSFLDNLLKIEQIYKRLESNIIDLRSSFEGMEGPRKIEEKEVLNFEIVKKLKHKYSIELESKKPEIVDDEALKDLLTTATKKKKKLKVLENVRRTDGTQEEFGDSEDKTGAKNKIVSQNTPDALNIEPTTATTLENTENISDGYSRSEQNEKQSKSEKIPKRKKNIPKPPETETEHEGDDTVIQSKITQSSLNRMLLRPMNNAKESFLKTSGIKKAYTERKKRRRLVQYILATKNVKSYQKLNIRAIQNILKVFKTNEKWIANELSILTKNLYIFRSRFPAKLYNISNSYFAQKYKGGNNEASRRAIERAEHPEGVERAPFLLFFCGVLIATSIFLTYTVYKKAIVKDGMVWSFYFALMSIISGFWMFGISMHIYDRHRINYRFIFGLIAESKLSIINYLFITSLIMVITPLIFLFSFTLSDEYCRWTLRSILPVYAIFFIFPFKFLYKESRFYVIYCLMKILCSPFFRVTFRSFFFTDVLASFIGCIMLIIRFYIGDKHATFLLIIVLLPSVLRIVQCLRRMFDDEKLSKTHIQNSFKYLFSLFSMVLVFLYLPNIRVFEGITMKKENLLDPKLISYMTVATISAVFNIYWDFENDWKIRRIKKLFSLPFYVLTGILNILIRFTWLHHLFSEFPYRNVLISAEIIRRMLWSLIRVELEHLNNCNVLIDTQGIPLEMEDLFYRREKKDVETATTTTVDEIEIV